jgi:hypothetical protein
MYGVYPPTWGMLRRAVREHALRKLVRRLVQQELQRVAEAVAADVIVTQREDGRT